MTKPDFPSTSVSPASPNSDLTSNKDQSMTLFKTVNGNTHEAEIEAYHHTLDVINEGNEMNRTHLLEVKDEAAKTPCSYAGCIIHQPATNNTGLPIMKTGEGDKETHAGENEIRERSNEHFSRVLKITPRIPDNAKTPKAADIQVQWPSQEATSNESMGELLRPPESTTAFTPPTSMPIIPLPVHSCLRPSLVLDCRLRWKPPDRGGETRRRAWYVISKKLGTSAVPHLPKSSTALVPFSTSPALLQARHHCLLSLELIWQTRRKLPNTTGERRQPSNTIVSADGNASVRCSHTRGSVYVAQAPAHILVASRQPHCLNNELATRACKPPDLMAEQGPLVGGIGKAERGRRWSCLLAPCCFRLSRSLLLPHGIYLAFRQLGELV
ncbi:hypothetical protein AX14_005276 [Amanita brunnescens Koide BX004]|nr:hypothetical protein AX14_005276 [Amanita brunnescens Koide BX004]